MDQILPPSGVDRFRMNTSTNEKTVTASLQIQGTGIKMKRRNQGQKLMFESSKPRHSLNDLLVLEGPKLDTAFQTSIP
jgi:hypothetical protein